MKSIVKISLLTLVLIILSGCRYYEAVSKSNPGKGDVIWAQYNNKRFYIHSGSRVFGLTEVIGLTHNLGCALGAGGRVILKVALRKLGSGVVPSPRSLKETPRSRVSLPFFIFRV